MPDPGAHTAGLGGALYLGGDTAGIVSCGADGRICIRNMEAVVQEEVPRLDNSPITCLALHRERQYYATAESTNAVHVRLPHSCHMIPGSAKSITWG